MSCGILVYDVAQSCEHHGVQQRFQLSRLLVGGLQRPPADARALWLYSFVRESLGLNHRWCMRFHLRSPPRRAQPGHVHCTAPPAYLTKPPLDHLSLHHSTNLESFFSITSPPPASFFFSTALGSAAAAVEAVLRTASTHSHAPYSFADTTAA